MPGTTGNWQHGFDKSIIFAGVALKIKGTTWDEQIEKLIVTHSQSGGVQGWIPGILDGNGNVTACIDANIMPLTLSIVAGSSAQIIWSLGSANAFQIPVGVVKVHYQAPIAGIVEYNFDVAMNSEVGIYVRGS